MSNQSILVCFSPQLLRSAPPLHIDNYRKISPAEIAGDLCALAQGVSELRGDVIVDCSAFPILFLVPPSVEFTPPRSIPIPLPMEKAPR